MLFLTLREPKDVIAELEGLGSKVVLAPDSLLSLAMAQVVLAARSIRCHSIKVSQSSNDDPGGGIIELTRRATSKDEVICGYEWI